MPPSSIADNWTHLDSEEGESLKLFKTRFDCVRNEANGQESKMIILEAADSVNVIALTEAGELVLARQYRFGTREVTIELPGGIIDPGEEPLEAVQRELREETGYTSDDWHYLGSAPSNPVYMDNYCHHWLAFKARKTTETSFDPSELVELVHLPVDQLKSAIKEGQISHPHSLSALSRVFDLRTFSFEQLPV